MTKLYVISDGEAVYGCGPNDQPSDNNPEPLTTLTTMKAARAALAEWEQELGYNSEDDIPSPLEIYKLVRVK